MRFCAAAAIAVALGAPLTAVAQGGFFEQRQPPPPYTPAKDAKDLKAVLFNWTWHMGMLRGIDEHELIASLEYQGKGTLQVDGQPCSLTKYRVSTSYQTPGQRTQIACTKANGQKYAAIEVVSGPYAWNEDIPGAELVKGKGKATPLAGAVQERLIRLWASPQGAPKAALAGTKQPDANRLPDDGAATIGATMVTWEAGKPVVTYPIPGVPGATATVTLNAKYMAESVVVNNGPNKYEFAYGDYADWNNPLNKVEVLYAGKMTEKLNGKVVRDLVTTETETGSVYVVMPVPASVKAAIKVATPYPAVVTIPVLASPFGPPAQQPPLKDEPTPRTADGKPDLTGNWNGFVGFFNWRYGFRRCGPTQTSDCSTTWNQTIDFEFEAPSRYGPNRPIYKPEFWDKVQQLDMWTNKEDPVMTCQPLGVPRQGGPSRIFQTAHDVTFIYGGGFDGGGGYPEYRVIPTDGRKHNPNDQTTRYMGATVGTWEGDTLVLDSVGFNDQTWLARGGFFHSDEMHVVEKFTRKGNEILYEVTVEDPQVLVEPWVMTPRTLQANTAPDAGLIQERGNCEVYETSNITSQIRH
ncbi:MAG TPA: hypothetical protein VL131_15890 [Gammaproteobacteria bacterium]|nr:hypothetical protein [Gammaproteobacteria bacterium]